MKKETLKNTPWTVGPNLHSAESDGAFYIRDCRGVTIAKLDSDSSENDEANGEVIAAAPELLDALQTLWAWVDDLGKSNPGYLGKLCLQDYAQMNEAFLKTECVLAKLSK